MYSQNFEEKNKKELRIIYIGIILVLLSGIVTIFRPFLKQMKKDVSTEIQPNNLPKISAADLIKKIRNKENIHIVDIRSEESFQNEHIVSSLNVPIENLNNFKFPFPLNDSVAIIGFATESQENQLAIEAIKNAGYNDVSVVIGGISAWKNSNGKIISKGSPSLLIDQSKITYIAPDDLNVILEKNADSILILDVRAEQTFSQEHMAKAINIFLEKLETDNSKISLGNQIITYGENEIDSFQSGVRLYDLGFYNVKVLKGGFTAWKEKGFPTTNQ